MISSKPRLRLLPPVGSAPRRNRVWECRGSLGGGRSSVVGYGFSPKEAFFAWAEEGRLAFDPPYGRR